jgi:hypothetical protein
LPIIKKLSVILNVPEQQVDPKKGLRDNGVDSHVAVQFRAWITRELASEVNLVEIFAKKDLSELRTGIVAASPYVKHLNYR